MNEKLRLSTCADVPSRLHHIGWVVRSLDRAVPHFTKVWGFEAAEVEEFPGLRVAFLELPNMLVELLEPRGDADIETFLAERGEGIHHLALEVTDVAAALTSAVGRELSVLDTEPRPGARGTTIGFVDPRREDGVLLEYVQEAS